MKIRLLLALAAFAMGFVLPTLAQQKGTVDPKIKQRVRVLAAKYDQPPSPALHTQDGIRTTNEYNHATLHGRQAIEKSYAHDFQRWHPYNHVMTVDRLNAVGKDVRADGRWSQTHVSDINRAPMHREGYFKWIMVREGDTWKIRRSIFSENAGPFSTNG